MENSIQITVPAAAAMNFETLQIARRPNFTFYLTETEDDVSRIADPDYEQFLADVWVGIVLTLMVLSCVCCMCSCLLYHKFQQWKMNVVEARRRANNTATHQPDSESLPSYTIVSGLPSYDEALEQLRKIRETSVHIPSEVKLDLSNNEQWIPQTPPTPVASLSVLELFQLYKTTNNTTTNVPLSSVDSKT